MAVVLEGVSLCEWISVWGTSQLVPDGAGQKASRFGLADIHFGF